MKTKNIDSLLWKGYNVPENIKAEINLLFNMSVNELRAKYREVLGYNMNSRNKDFLLKKIAWKIQANIFGDISDELKKRAIDSVDFSRLRVRNTTPTNRTTPLSPTISMSGNFSFERPVNLSRDRRLPMVGCILAKNYNGRKIAVKVLEKGFEFENEHYSSLSGIARKVTGTNWNGFKFFDL